MLNTLLRCHVFVRPAAGFCDMHAGPLSVYPFSHAYTEGPLSLHSHIHNSRTCLHSIISHKLSLLALCHMHAPLSTWFALFRSLAHIHNSTSSPSLKIITKGTLPLKGMAGKSQSSTTYIFCRSFSCSCFDSVFARFLTTTVSHVCAFVARGVKKKESVCVMRVKRDCMQME